ncbi:MAG: GTPase [Candidatus Niyogibacteria bacterium CG10_big_fil_rev_8_21_14_0_10_46_36]|uniref:GTPase n=1 Tax=Candidatus Niyogibacteria bacterium CG10_big_fil_rev_8_21_14_0_10_46_36 TaxID=1974726 RepID=A0A2H0TCB1_9BACT|nr:MAG: GTPase [Candidatus Niyogibacteria bacterium CG10_big_fil_rev_8_21_14_0_10_46_36]
MKLLFVYNADSGILSSLKDTVHKAVSPNTYQCNLCKVTFGTTSMKESWKSFVESLPYDVEFLHRDEFQEQYPEKNDEPLPALFIIEDESIESAISAETINKAHSVTDLITTVSSFLERMNKDKNI